MDLVHRSRPPAPLGFLHGKRHACGGTSRSRTKDFGPTAGEPHQDCMNAATPVTSSTLRMLVMVSPYELVWYDEHASARAAQCCPDVFFAVAGKFLSARAFARGVLWGKAHGWPCPAWGSCQMWWCRHEHVAVCLLVVVPPRAQARVGAHHPGGHIP